MRENKQRSFVNIGPQKRPAMVQNIVDVTLTLLGEPGIGKTSIKKYLMGKPFNEDEKMTLGAQYNFLRISENFPELSSLDIPDRLKICDIAGQQSYRDIRERFMGHSDAAMMVFDITDPTSFEIIEDWMIAYLKANKASVKTNLPILLVGNKADLEEERRVTLNEVKEVLIRVTSLKTLSHHVIGYIEVSAKTGLNIGESLEKIIENIERK